MTSTVPPGRAVRLPRRRTVVWVLLVLVVGAIVLFGYQAARTGWAAYRASTLADRAVAQVKDGHYNRARVTLTRLREQARIAHDNSDGILWDAASILPVVGRQVGAVQVTTEVVDDTANGALPVALGMAQTISDHKLRHDDGTFDTDAIAALQPRVARFDRDLARPSARIATVDAGELWSPLQERVVRLQDLLRQAAEGARTADAVTRIAPDLLGADGPRTYMLVVQNNAELRATGGLPGTMLMLHTRAGRLEIGDQLFGGGLGIRAHPVAPLTPEERHIYGIHPAVDIRDSNMIPDFPRVAQLMEARVDHDFHIRPDGIIAVDPVTLTYVMQATGPVQVGSQRLDANNLLDEILHRVYVRLDINAQDRYFSRVASAVFSHLTSGRGDQGAILSGLAKGVGERRVLMWSAHPEEQRLLQPTALSGAALRGPQAPQVGFYLNDGAGSKMEYYLAYSDQSLTTRRCSEDGAASLRAELTLRSTATASVAKQPWYVSGRGRRAPKGYIRLILRIYGPAGGAIDRVTLNGHPPPLRRNTHDSHPVAALLVQLAPGQRAHITADVRTAGGQRVAPTFAWTPGIHTTQSQTRSEPCG